MRPIILKCPSCDGNLTVARLDCPDCSISIEGEFAPPALLKLTGAQIDFVEVFIKNRGVIREVERELGVSYPTVRARLDDVITALGYSPKSAPEASTSDDSGSRRGPGPAGLQDGKTTPHHAPARLQ